MSFDDLVATALVGTANRPFVVGGVPGEHLLDAAASWAAVRRASPPVAERVAPEPSPDIDPNVAPPRITSLISFMTRNSPDSSVAEALLLIGQAGMVLPPRLVVELAPIAAKSSEMAAAMRPVLGARGEWVVRQHPIWLRGKGVEATASPDPSWWDEGTPAQRAAWVAHVRASDPAAGRELVASAKKDKAADRAKLVRELAVGLSLADEEFLEATLGDRSKEVAGCAAELLATLPGSAYLNRVFALASKAFHKAGLFRKVIEATAPTLEDIGRDRWDAATGGRPDARAGDRLFLLVSLVPPRRWAELVGIEASELGSVVLDGERVDLTGALVRAAARWDDADLARTLLQTRPDPRLLGVLPPADREQWAPRVIAGLGDDVFGELDALLPDGWLSGEVSAAILKRLRGDKVTQAGGAAALALLGRRSHPAHAIDIVPAINLLARQLPTHKQAATRAVETLTLRSSVYEATQHKESR